MIPEFIIWIKLMAEFTKEFPAFEEVAHKHLGISLRREISKFNHSLHFDRIEIKDNMVYYDGFYIGRIEVHSGYDNDSPKFVITYKFIPK